MSTGRQGKYSHYPCSKNDRGPQKGVHFADDTTGLSSSASPPSPLVGAHGQNDTKTASFPALNTGLNIAASVSSTTTKNFGATPAISGFYQGTQQVGTVGTSSTSQQYPYQGFAYQQYPSCVIYQFPIQNSTTNMAATDNYQNTSNPNNGLHFQPQVPDTTYGTIPHTYIPRFDGGTIFAHPLCHAPGIAVTTPIGTPYAIPATAQAVMYHQAAAQAPMVIPLAGRTQYVPALGGVAVPVAAVATSGLATGTAIPVPAAAAGGVAAVGGAGVTLAGGCGPPPEITGIGRTAGETALEQCQFAYANGLFEPQDIKPADDDPSRYYPVREVDGNWTQRNRFTIDNLGDCRWYVTNEGYFYAVRMPN